MTEPDSPCIEIYRPTCWDNMKCLSDSSGQHPPGPSGEIRFSIFYKGSFYIFMLHKIWDLLFVCLCYAHGPQGNFKWVCIFVCMIEYPRIPYVLLRFGDLNSYSIATYNIWLVRVHYSCIHAKSFKIACSKQGLCWTHLMRPTPLNSWNNRARTTCINPVYKPDSDTGYTCETCETCTRVHEHIENSEVALRQKLIQ